MILRLDFAQEALLTGRICNSLPLIHLKPSSVRGTCAHPPGYGRSHSAVRGRVDVRNAKVDRSYSKVMNVRADVSRHVQTLREYPRERLHGKVVLVRFDSSVLLQKDLDDYIQSEMRSMLFTIKFVYNAGAKVILISNWDSKGNSMFHSLDGVAEYLSSALDIKVVPAPFLSIQVQTKMEHLERGHILLLDNLSHVKEEVANDIDFSRNLSSGVDIFVNESFSLAHRVLASTVGVTRFCCSCVAGFHFERLLNQLQNIIEYGKHPYFAIIGGGNLVKKATALKFLLSKCDGLIFVGRMAFQIMHALGMGVPLNLIEQGALSNAEEIIHLAASRNTPIIFPKDFWCVKDLCSQQQKIFPADEIPDGWSPVDIGPNSLAGITSVLSSCKKILWIGTLKFRLSDQISSGATELALLLEKLSQQNCDVTVVGNRACEAVVKIPNSISAINRINSASVVWDFLKTTNVPGISGLDRAYPYEIDWKTVYHESSQHLVVDLGSGNGMFLMGMANKRRDTNFLGLEMNEKLVHCCMASVNQSSMKNIYFIATNATSTFRTIVSSYPGPLTLVSIQCPNPDFNQPDYRWRMVQKSLIEDIAELLVAGGKVFLQSDVEAVAVRMKDQFLEESKGKLVIAHNDEDDDTTDSNGWLKENPFGVRSDWERHVIARGEPMYRIMLCKV